MALTSDGFCVPKVFGCLGLGCARLGSTTGSGAQGRLGRSSPSCFALLDVATLGTVRGLKRPGGTSFPSRLDLARLELGVVLFGFADTAFPVTVELTAKLLGAEIFGECPEVCCLERTLIAKDHDGGHPLEEDADDEVCVGERDELGIVEAGGGRWRWILGTPDLVPLFLVFASDEGADAGLYS